MKVPKERFKEAYNTLNLEQKEAVDTIEGPVMVIAGPGTGKTQILTLRIANILEKTDSAPESILALTFTESGARAMRERLHSYIGARAYQVPIYTFHGFAEQCIREYPDAYERVVGGRPVTDVEKIDIFQSIIDGGGIRLLRPMGDTSYYTNKVANAIAELKREYVTPDAFATHIASEEEKLAKIPQYHEKGAHKGKIRGEFAKKEKSVAKNKELLLVYRAYEAVLREQRLYDFEDMIVETVCALETHDDMLRDLQETYQYLLADEHQDVNGSQNRILELLASYHERPNIFVVGDEKQAIFRFQGASLENFLYFEDVFEGTITIALTSNYRSGQKVLDATHSLIVESEGPLSALRIPLVAKGKESARVERRTFSHTAIEDNWVAERVVELLKEGIPPEEIAVIVRTNREVEAFAGLLRKRGIAVNPSADSDILEHPITNVVQSLIEAVAHPEREDFLMTLLHGPYWGITVADLVRVCASRSYHEPLGAIVRSPDRLRALKLENADAFLNVTSVLHKARELEMLKPPHRVLEYLLRESGFLEHAVASDPEEAGRVIRRLYDEIEAMVIRNEVSTLRDVGKMFATRRAYRLPLTAPYIGGDPHAVSVMTAHKSKGLEFEAVIVPHLVDSLWGGATRRTYFELPLTKHIEIDALDSVDDERRLLYVAMTRAKSLLSLSSSEMNADGRGFIPSRLFDRIDSALYESTPTEPIEAVFKPTDVFAVEKAHEVLDPQVLSTRFLERGLSATALNNYLASPWTYFYRNMLRIPEVQTESLLFGTAVHSVLERVVAYQKTKGELPNNTTISTYLKQALERLPLNVSEYATLHEKGLVALTVYCSELVLPKRSDVEFSIRAVLQTDDLELPEIPLTGKLDRLDFDEEGKVLRVVDYKTGKPKTRGYVEGTTKDSRGDYKRQLVFYALLLSLLDDERYNTREGVLSFVEPDAKGKIVEYSYTVTDEEINALKVDIVRVAKEITHGAFLNAPCDPEVSTYCNLVDLLRLER